MIDDNEFKRLSAFARMRTALQNTIRERDERGLKWKVQFRTSPRDVVIGLRIRWMELWDCEQRIGCAVQILCFEVFWHRFNVRNPVLRI